jgi:hypothetical protein
MFIVETSFIPLRRLLLEMFTFADFIHSLDLSWEEQGVTPLLLTLLIDVLNKTPKRIKIELGLNFSSNLDRKTSFLTKKLLMLATKTCSSFTLNLIETPYQCLTPLIK